VINNDKFAFLFPRSPRTLVTEVAVKRVIENVSLNIRKNAEQSKTRCQRQ
jgi:hypothetical protein